MFKLSSNVNQRIRRMAITVTSTSPPSFLTFCSCSFVRSVTRTYSLTWNTFRTLHWKFIETEYTNQNQRASNMQEKEQKKKKSRKQIHKSQHSITTKTIISELKSFSISIYLLPYRFIFLPGRSFCCRTPTTNEEN